MLAKIAEWPEWDYVLKLAAFLASLAAIFGVPFLIYQIRLARTAFRAEQTERTKQLERHQTEQVESLNRREAEEADRRRRHRATILTALQVEAETISKGVEQDLKDFDLLERDNPRTQAVINEGEIGYRRGFVWTPLPMSTVEQAIHEAYLLDLTKEQLEVLQDLRLRLLRANALIGAKVALLPGLSETGAVREVGGWADKKAHNVNSVLRNEFGQIRSACEKISRWTPKDEASD